MTIRIRCGGTSDGETPEKIITHPNLLSLKIYMIGGIHIIGPCEGDPLEEFYLGGAHFALYEDELGREMQTLLDGYEGTLLLDVKINDVHVVYTK